MGAIPDIAVLGIDVTSTSVTPAAAALDKLTAAAAKTGPAVDKVAQASKSAAPELDRVAASSTKAATATEGLGRGGAAVTSAFARFGPQIQQAGYQVGDFAVQVASGGNAIVAFTQQGAQLAGMFGPAGAVAGAVLGIGGALVATLIPALTGSGGAAEGAIGKFLAYTDGLDKARKGADDLAKAIRGLSDAQLKQQIADSEAKRRTAAEPTEAGRGGNSGLSAYRWNGTVLSVDPEQVRLEARLKEEQQARERAAVRLGPPPGDEGRPTAESRREDARLRAARAAGADPFAGQRKAQSLYPPSSGDQTGYQAELNARVVADANKKAAEDKAAQSKRDSEAKAEANRLAAEAKARAEHAKTIAKSLEDMTVAANDNAAALTKQRAALEGGITNSIQLEQAQKQAQATRDQVAIETSLRRFRGEASAEQIQTARAALQAQAEASRSLEEQTRLVQEQVQWEQQLSQAKRERADADRQRLQELQGQTASMQLDQQRSKIDENRQAVMSYGQVAFDALSQVAIGGEKANVALGNLLKTWANMAAQAASQMLLRALSTALFPQATGTAAAFGASTAIAGQRASGGDTEAGRTYVVGEHGRERFTPWTKGRVEPMGRSQGGGQSINVSTTNNISLSGSATDQDAERVARAVDKKMNDTIDARLARHARSGGAFAA